jgi:arylsulfatase A-like enzyme
MRSLVAVLVAGVVATALDVLLCAFRGYILRGDLLLLLGMEFLLMVLCAALAYAVLMVLGRLRAATSVVRSMPRAIVLLAAWAPVGLLRIRRLETPTSLIPELLILLLVGMFGYAEARRAAAPPGPWSASFVVFGSALVVWAAVAIPLPGRSMLRPPENPARPAATVDGQNLLLIVLDTLRAEHLGVYGYPKPTSPFLDGFSEKAYVFERAVSASSWTLPSHATLFTGLFPRSHGAHSVEADEPGIDARYIPRTQTNLKTRPLASEAVTLAELAREHGLETGAICANVAFLYDIFGLDQGFETYVDELGNRRDWIPVGTRLAGELGLRRSWPYRRAVQRNHQNDRFADEVTRLALEWIDDRRDRPFFLFLNYFDPHAPYWPPGRYARRFSYAGPPLVSDEDAVLSGERELSPDDRNRMVEAYDAEIRFLDDQLGVLFRSLEAWGLLDRTLVVITGDHGESFGEHFDLGHGNNVYETEVRIPLIMRYPGQQAGRRVNRIVHLVDIFPTLLEALGIEPPPGQQGDGLLSGRRTHPAVAFVKPHLSWIDLHPRFAQSHVAVYRDPWKLVLHSDGTEELYDIRQDRDEQSDLAAERPDLVSELRRELQVFEDAVQPRFASQATELDDETLLRLKALGYVQFVIPP